MATCKAGDIYDQAWFRGADWAAIEEMRIPPPFVPEVVSCLPLVTIRQILLPIVRYGKYVLSSANSN